MHNSAAQQFDDTKTCKLNEKSNQKAIQWLKNSTRRSIRHAEIGLVNYEDLFARRPSRYYLRTLKSASTEQPRKLFNFDWVGCQPADKKARSEVKFCRKENEKRINFHGFGLKLWATFSQSDESHPDFVRLMNRKKVFCRSQKVSLLRPSTPLYQHPLRLLHPIWLLVVSSSILFRLWLLVSLERLKSLRAFAANRERGRWEAIMLLSLLFTWSWWRDYDVQTFFVCLISFLAFRFSSSIVKPNRFSP